MVKTSLRKIIYSYEIVRIQTVLFIQMLNGLNDVISDIDSAFNSDSETETDSTKSGEEETPANSRKRKNSFVTDPIPKKSRGN